MKIKKKIKLSRHSSSDQSKIRKKIVFRRSNSKKMKLIREKATAFGKRSRLRKQAAVGNATRNNEIVTDIILG